MKKSIKSIASQLDLLAKEKGIKLQRGIDNTGKKCVILPMGFNGNSEKLRKQKLREELDSYKYGGSDIKFNKTTDKRIK